MDFDFLILLLVIAIISVIMMGPFIIGDYSENAKKRDYVNSVVAETGDPSLNEDLMTQMRPSDEVVTYKVISYRLGNKMSHGYIAVTKERLIFKAVSAGDHTAVLNNAFANNRGASAGFNLRFDLKEETCNIPISKVTSMATSREVFELKGCISGRDSISAYVLKINAQGAFYNLFLGKHKDVADEFVRTFTSMSYERDD